MRSEWFIERDGGILMLKVLIKRIREDVCYIVMLEDCKENARYQTPVMEPTDHFLPSCGNHERRDAFFSLAHACAVGCRVLCAFAAACASFVRSSQRTLRVTFAQPHCALYTSRRLCSPRCSFVYLAYPVS